MFPSRRFFDTRDEQVLRFLDRLGALEKHWPCVNSVLCPLLEEEEITCFFHLYSLMLDLGSAFFHFFLDKFLEHLVSEEYAGLSEVLERIVDDDATAYRFVWMSTRKGKLITLCKSALTFHTREECLTNGARYQPSLDIESGESLLMSWERVPSGCERRRPDPFAWSEGRERREGVLKMGETHYNYLCAGEEFVFRMPWDIRKSGRTLYIFYIQKCDLWFYSCRREIFDAYHEHALHN